MLSAMSELPFLLCVCGHSHTRVFKFDLLKFKSRIVEGLRIRTKDIHKTKNKTKKAVRTKYKGKKGAKNQLNAKEPYFPSFKKKQYNVKRNKLNGVSLVNENNNKNTHLEIDMFYKLSQGSKGSC